MPTLLRKEDVPIEQITSLVALLVLPWVFKFLWAPLVDSLRSDSIGFKHWIAGTQIFMALTLVPLLFISPEENFALWGAFLFLHSFSAATQDVAIDALVINEVAYKERGMLNGFMQAGMLTGRSIFGGGTIAIASTLGLNAVLTLLIAVISITMFLLIFVKEPAYKLKKDRLQNFWNNLSGSFTKTHTWLGVAFALIAAAAFESAGALAGPFLVDKEVDEKMIGLFFSVLVVGAMLTGGLIGGYLSDRLSRKKSVGVFLIGFVLIILSIAVADEYLSLAAGWFLGLFTLMYFFVGLFTSSSYALFMDITNPRIGGTQFSSYMAATNGCESWSVWVAGGVTERAGYAAAFALMSVVSLSSLIILKRIKRIEAE